MSKKTALIDAAKDLLWEKGYEATSPRDIQSRSGSGQGSFYHHFSSKKDLAIAALEEISAEMITLFRDRLGQSGPARRKLEEFLSKPRIATKGCRIGRLANETALQDPDLAQPVRAYFEALQSLLSEAVRECQAEGSLPADLSAEDLATTLIAAVQGGFVLGRIHDAPDMHRTISRSLISLLDFVSAGTAVK